MSKKTSQLPAPSDITACDCGDVDRSSNAEFVKGCLELMQSLKFFRQSKARSYALLGVKKGCHILDVGCGAGGDAMALGQAVGKSGRVTAIDKSTSMVEEARSKAGGVSNVCFQVCDAHHLPFAAGSFDGARVERTLQHVVDPSLVVREITRVVRPSGVIVAIEPDWETLVVDSEDDDLGRRMGRHFSEGIRNGTIGRALHRLFQQAGLKETEVFPETLILTEFGVANQVFHLTTTARDAADKGLFERGVAENWVEGLRRRDHSGEFFSALTFFMARGRKLGEL